MTAGQGPHSLGKQRDVQRSERAVEERGAEQVEDRAEQGEEQVAQRGGERLRLPLDAGERHGREGEQFERDVEVEEVAADEDDRERGADRLEHDPERESLA